MRYKKSENFHDPFFKGYDFEELILLLDNHKNDPFFRDIQFYYYVDNDKKIVNNIIFFIIHLKYLVMMYYLTLNIILKGVNSIDSLIDFIKVELMDHEKIFFNGYDYLFDCYRIF